MQLGKGQLWKEHVNAIFYVLGTLGPQSIAKQVNYCCENQSVWERGSKPANLLLCS